MHLAPNQRRVKARHWQWTGVAVGLAGFLAVWMDVRLHGPLSGADRPTYDWLARLQDHGIPMGSLGDIVSAPVSVPAAVALTALAAIWWWVLGQRWLAGWAAGSGLLVGAAIFGLKESIQRELPPRAAGAWYRYSFPSGHTISATANVGLLFLLGAQVLVNRRDLPGQAARRVWRWAIVLWSSCALAMGLARIASQRHWASDVVASWAIGLALTCLALLLAGIPHPPRERPRTFLACRHRSR